MHNAVFHRTTYDGIAVLDFPNKLADAVRYRRQSSRLSKFICSGSQQSSCKTKASGRTRTAVRVELVPSYSVSRPRILTQRLTGLCCICP